jgi:hypothetical protein
MHLIAINSQRPDLAAFVVLNRHDEVEILLPRNAKTQEAWRKRAKRNRAVKN